MTGVLARKCWPPSYEWNLACARHKTLYNQIKSIRTKLVSMTVTTTIKETVVVVSWRKPSMLWITHLIIPRFWWKKIPFESFYTIMHFIKIRFAILLSCNNAYRQHTFLNAAVVHFSPAIDLSSSAVPSNSFLLYSSSKENKFMAKLEIPIYVMYFESLS